MSVELTAESPMAKTLQGVVQPKLVEMGWSSEAQDDTLSEYIVLMLANGKSQDQIAVELATDLLDLPAEDQSTKDFSRWLFEQVNALVAQTNGAPAPADQMQESADASNSEMAGQDDVDDMDMGDVPAGPSSSVPTGPRNMRNGNGSGAQRGRDRRMLGQVNKTLGQNDGLHKIRGAAGGRINSHANRDPPRGPRNQQLQRNVANAVNRGAGNGVAGGAPGMPSLPQLPQGGNMMNLQDQMQFFATLAENAQMMAWQMQQMGVPGAASMPGAPNGKSLFDRVEKRHARQNNPRHHNQNNGHAQGENGAAGDAEMGENATQQDASHTLCRFDTTCGKFDCHFAHHSPVARPGSMLPQINMDTECSFGLACKNFNCPDRHESRAKKMAHQAEQECMYGLFCQKPNCPFKHPPPTMKPCRNGADCTTPNCPFWHSKIECKHNPCKNAMCPYKHKDGQKVLNFGDHVWTADGSHNKEHVSERKFTDESAPEEVIVPGQSAPPAAQPVMEAEMIS